jgi:hypothetical protein
MFGAERGRHNTNPTPNQNRDAKKYARNWWAGLEPRMGVGAADRFLILPVSTFIDTVELFNQIQILC